MTVLSSGDAAEGAAPPGPVLSGMTWPYRSAYQGVAISGTVESFERGWREYLTDVFVFSCPRRTFVLFDVLNKAESEWKLDSGVRDPTDLASFNQYLFLGPFRTPFASSLTRTAVFNHPFDFKFSTAVGAPVSELPSLVFQVFDQDLFGRQVLLGYGLLRVPTSSSSSLAPCEFQIPLWIPKDAQSFADQVCGVYRPLCSRADIADRISRRDIATLARTGTLTVNLQLTHVLGKLKPEVSASAPASATAPAPVSAPAPAAAAAVAAAPPVVSAVLETPVRAPPRGSRLPASLAPLSRVLETEATPVLAAPVPATPGPAALPPMRRRAAPAEAEPPVAQTAPGAEEPREMASDEGFAAAVAAITMSARARRRRAKAEEEN